MVPLITTKSWLGQEDLKLEDKLTKELPGILNRALAGLRRLNANGGKFTPVESADAILRALEALASPVKAFVRETCELGGDFQEDTGVLYRAYKGWCGDNGHAVPSSAMFGKMLFAAFPEITRRRPRTTDEDALEPAAAAAVAAVKASMGFDDDKDRQYVYAGIRIVREAGTNVTPLYHGETSTRRASPERE
jgi:phage/plasmid-associated DNA primase